MKKDIPKLDDVPGIEGNRYPKRITIAVSDEQYNQLEEIRKNKKKSAAAIIRTLLTWFLKDQE